MVEFLFFHEKQSIEYDNFSSEVRTCSNDIFSCLLWCNFADSNGVMAVEAVNLNLVIQLLVFFKILYGLVGIAKAERTPKYHLIAFCKEFLLMKHLLNPGFPTGFENMGDSSKFDGGTLVNTYGNMGRLKMVLLKSK